MNSFTRPFPFFIYRFIFKGCYLKVVIENEIASHGTANRKTTYNSKIFVAKFF